MFRGPRNVGDAFHGKIIFKARNEKEKKNTNTLATHETAVETTVPPRSDARLNAPALRNAHKNQQKHG